MLKLNSVLGCLILLMTGLPHLVAQNLALVPQPHSVNLVPGEPGLELGKKIQVIVPDDQPIFREHFRVFGAALRLLCECEVEFSSHAAHQAPGITLQLDPSHAAEAYQLAIRDNQVLITASTIKGVSHATSSLLQLLGNKRKQALPQIEIRDQPDSCYRSLLIDLGRNPHSLTCLKETIDLLWYYKLDALQLHLTDNQRFAFPSKAFPKLLTEHGKITWEEFEELDRYAQVRGVSIIPELEVPGHSGQLRNKYPEVFGKDLIDVARLRTSRDAIKVLLDEMIELFPSSPYIHVGGDEAYGVPEDLQRDLINELHTHLEAKGKKTLVWEGPGLGAGDNKVHEKVIHINWRTVNFPADKMLAAGYRIVNAAWDPLYIVDHFSRKNFTMVSPEYIYRKLDLYRFAHFNPAITTFHDPVQVEPNDRVIGFCMPWWEGREENFFPMVVPRVIPLAEIAWNTKKEKDYQDFSQRSIASERIRERCFYPVSIAASPLVLQREGVFHDQTMITLNSEVGGDVRYTLNGKQPTPESTLYQEPFPLEKTAFVRAATFVDDKQVGHGSRRTLVHVQPVKNLALGKQVATNVTSGPLFSAARLTDGGTGNLDYFLGYPTEPEPILITVDLEKMVSFNRVVTHAFSNDEAFESYEIQVSRDGETFEQIAARLEKPEPLSPVAVHDFPETPARFVRIVTHGCKGYGFASFSRLTEIQVFSVKPQE